MYQQTLHRSTGAAPESAERKPAGNTFWRKLGGGALTFAVLFHMVLLIIGAIWIFQRIYEPEKKIDFLPGGAAGGGGGQRGAKYDVQRKKQAMATPTVAPKRVFAEGMVSNFVLPQQDDSFGEMSSLSSLAGGGLSGGLGGSGSGGGLGSGTGKGAGPGFGDGLGGAGGKATLFGMLGQQSNRLLGCIYDLTQNKDGTPNQYKPMFAPSNCSWQDPLVSGFMKDNWPESFLNKFYQGPAQLGVHQILIPCTKDDAAPQAFQAEGKMKGGSWLIVYRGKVQSPENGEIRFCGTADNYLGVRFSGKNVLYFASGDPKDSVIPLSPVAPAGLRMPVATGKWSRVNRGSWYDVEILIGDAGGVFSAVLYYEVKGKPGKKYLFRTEAIPWDDVINMDDGSYFGKQLLDLPRDLEVDSPVWKAEAPSDFRANRDF